MAALTAFFFLATACSGDSPEDVSPPGSSSSTTSTVAPTTTAAPITTTTTTASPTTTTTEPTELSETAAVAQLILTYYGVAAIAFDPPTEDFGGWDSVALDALEEDLRQTSLGLLEEGQGVRVTVDPEDIVFELRITEMSTDQAVVDVCMRDYGELYDLATGEIVESAEVPTWRQHVVVRTADGWLVQITRLIESFNEEEECASHLS